MPSLPAMPLPRHLVLILAALASLAGGPFASAAAPLLERGILAPATAEYPHPRYVSLARMNNNDLLALYAGMSDASPDRAAILSSYSTDHGRTWSRPVVAVDSPETMDADPSIVVAKDRVLAVATTRKANELIWTKFPFATSTDHGRTWKPSGEINHFHNYSSGKLQAATRLRTGRLLLPYCFDQILETKGAAIKEQAERNMISVASVLYSDDDGHTWKPGGDLDIKGVPGGGGINGLDEICLTQLADGSIYALCRTGVDRLYEARSTDQGLTWTKPQPSALVASNAPASMITLSRSDGAVVVIWNETAKNDRKPLAVAYSTDGCRTWSKSRVVFEDYSPYPSIVQAADGTIVVSWFQRAADKTTSIGFARFNWEWLTSGK